MLHLEISGSDFKDLNPKNKESIKWILFVIHLEIFVGSFEEI